MGQKRTLEPARVLPSTQQLRQLGDIRRDPPRLIFRELIGRRSPARLVLQVDVSELLAVVIAHDIDSRRLIPRLTRAAGAAFAVNLDQIESTKRGGVVVTPGAEQVKG
jgi:hypothetical protein